MSHHGASPAGCWPASVPGPLASGEAVEIATGAMVPAGTAVLIRSEDAHLDADGRVSGIAPTDAGLARRR